MFIGHYGPAFALRAIATKGRKPKLWELFVAVQLVDLAWALLVLATVERYEVIPEGSTWAQGFRLQYGPYTHSLLAAVLWGVVAFSGYLLVRKKDHRVAALLFALAVVLHWPLDWLVHRPDLPLYDHSLTVGWNLWGKNPAGAFAVEAALVLAAIAWYTRSPSCTDKGKAWKLGAFMMLFNGAFYLLPTLPWLWLGALQAGGFFALLAWWASRIETPA